MRTLLRLLCVVAFTVTAQPLAAPRSAADVAPARELPKPNYDLASRWTSAKVGKYVFSTAVTPHWLEFSDRFWYSYETPAGHEVVDGRSGQEDEDAAVGQREDGRAADAHPAHAVRRAASADRHDPVHRERHEDPLQRDAAARLARSRTRPGRRSPATTQTQENQVQGGGGRGGRGGGRRRRPAGQQGGRGGAAGQGANRRRSSGGSSTSFATGTRRARTRSTRPRSRTRRGRPCHPTSRPSIFARGHNLFMMDAKNFELAKKKADDPAIQETQLTTDGEQYYGFARNGAGGQQQDDQQQQQDQGGQTTQGGGGAATRGSRPSRTRSSARARAAIGVTWSQDNKKFSVMRTDQRKVEDLWVINALANPRPRLETYKYGMPGEENQPQAELRRVRHRREEGHEDARPTRSRTSSWGWSPRRRRTCSARSRRPRRAGSR